MDISLFATVWQAVLAPWQTQTVFRSCTAQSRVAGGSNEHIFASIHPSLTLKCQVCIKSDPCGCMSCMPTINKVGLSRRDKISVLFY